MAWGSVIFTVREGFAPLDKHANVVDMVLVVVQGMRTKATLESPNKIEVG